MVKETIEIEIEQRKWGAFTNLFSSPTSNGKVVKVKLLSLTKGENISYQKHFKRNELWFVAEGALAVVINDSLLQMAQGTFVTIAQENWHTAYALEDTVVVEIQFGDACDEDDIERLYVEWSEIEENILKPSLTKEQ